MAPLLLVNEDAALVGCVADGADRLVGIKAGGITGDELRHGQKGYPIGADALLIACEGLHVVGFAQGDGPAWSRPPRGSRVYRPQGRVEARLGATYATLEKALADTADLADWIKTIRAAQAEQRKVAEKTALQGASMLRRAAASAAERLRADDAS
jgi:hypothetical protein